ncbi:hypothetical protein [Methylomonas albis]|uniref:HAF repeat-containing protein n=1 Tax=Methylomonas albis TaxID=1854563 RepID=A0ABR9CZI6_9GAMM|nr:hypothetical protein [Methylomonas albis]MBD9355961.1 hypothetical protein [Methylomonas albis]
MKYPSNLSLLVLLSLTVSGVASAAFDQYTIIDLGSLDPGGVNDYSYAFDINDRGDIVGFSKGADGLDHAFARMRGQTLSDLGQGRATSINNRRQLVGRGAGPNYLLWKQDAAGNWEALDLNIPVIPAPFLGQTIKINDRGNIAGAGEIGIFYWSNGQIEYIATNAGCFPLTVVGLNNRDEVLYGDSMSMYLVTNTGESVLGDGRFAELTAMNDEGEAVGLSAFASASSYFSTETGFTNPQTNQSFKDINNAGIAVGGGNYGSYVASFALASTFRAVIYSKAENSVVYLDTLIPNNPGWSLRIANGISDAGQIVGVGINPAGKTHAFLLTPVSPP